LNFLTRFRQLFLAKGLRSCNNLANKRGFRCCQWSRPAGSWWLIILGVRTTFQPKDKELWDPWSFFFGGIWVHVQVLESLLWLSGFETVMLVTCFRLKWYIRLLNVDQVVQIGAADACAPQTLVCIWSGVPFTAKHHTNRNIFRLSLNSWVCFVCVHQD